MAEAPPPAPDAPDKSDATSTDHPDTDWGADWESAFQAESDAFFAESGEDFFLDEDTAPAAATARPKADATLEAALEAAGDEETGTQRQVIGPSFILASLFVLLGRLVAIPAAVLSRIVLLFRWFTSLSVRNQLITLAGLALALLVGSAALWLLAGPQQPAAVVATGPGAPPGTPPPAELTPEVQAILAGVPEVPEKVRKKLPLNNFYIPIRDDKVNASISFVQIDIILNTLLGSEEELPPDKETLARDIIYQFFVNRTLAELRHYQLARGDLQRDLRAWLEKQWPEAPIESITFTRYQLG